MKEIYKLVILVAFAGLFAACGSDDKPTPPPTPPTPPVVNKEPDPDPISAFIWGGLDYYYLWEAEIDGLALEQDSEDWKKYLNKYETDYEGVFESLLYRQPDAQGHATLDKWSWFIDDYVKQEEAFAGISKSFGFEYKLSRYGDNGIFGYVTYVIPGSPAAATEIKRGDIFISVNGEDITLSNYRNLLFSNDSYTLGFADLEDKTLTSNDKEVSMDAVELTENPILKAETIDHNGTKVGYMVYNSFTGTPEFNKALNDSIGKLKAEGVTELVLDLRYNGGGSIYSAILLASMIDGAHTGELFSESKYNDRIQAQYEEKYGKDVFKDYFVDKITKRVNGEDQTVAMLNSLGLQRLFVLVSSGTASASELVINGLRPYMDVVLIGTNTHGKYVGSITVYDFVDNNGTKNPAHKYAMQPIVLKIANANGVTDYREGFAPDYERNEWDYLANIKPLGDPEEPYLKAALGVIAGESVPVKDAVATRGANNLETVFDSKDLKPFGKEMYDERMQMNLNELRK